MTLHRCGSRSATTTSSGSSRRWAQAQAGRQRHDREFIALAEQISGQDLDALFETWLYTPGKPELPAAARATARTSAAASSIVARQLRMRR